MKNLAVWILICSWPTWMASLDAQVSDPSQPLPQANTPGGEPLYSPPPSADLLRKYGEKERAYLDDTTNVDNLIWYGRFAAYTGDYLKAIEIYSRGINRFPVDARLYRHRGHRYITIREFDKAIADLEKAAELVRGTENRVEPDGMPNARNIPVSTLHGNIWYHLGLAHYLKHDFPAARKAYLSCLETGNNADNTVSATHWLYMIARRMGADDEAAACLEQVSTDMEIIENFSYHRNCLFYKGLLTAEQLVPVGSEGSSADASLYALGNWHLCNGDQEMAVQVFMELIASNRWNSFGYIAAEADLATLNGMRD